MGRYGVYCIYHRYTIIVHRIEIMGILKLLESYKWKKIAYGNQSKRIGFKMEDSIWMGNGSRWVEAEYTMQEYSALHLYSTCGLAIHMGRAVMSALVQQVQLLQGIRISHYLLYLGRRYASPNQIEFCMAVEICLQAGTSDQKIW